MDIGVGGVIADFSLVTEIILIPYSPLTSSSDLEYY
jgi:hypothetical protein